MRWSGAISRSSGCACLWHSQQSEPIPHEEVSLIVLAPKVSGALRRNCDSWAARPARTNRDFSLAGLPFTTWLVETDVMAERDQPILSLVSRVFLNDLGSIIEKLGRRGRGALALPLHGATGPSVSLREGSCHATRTIGKYGEASGAEILAKIMEWSPPAVAAVAGCLRKSGSAGCRRKSLRPRWANKMRRGFANYSNGNKAVMPRRASYGGFYELRTRESGLCLVLQHAIPENS